MKDQIDRNFSSAEQIHELLQRYVMLLPGGAIADAIERDLSANNDVFNPERVHIERHRASVTQGEVSLYYSWRKDLAGWDQRRRLMRFGDNVKLRTKEELEHHNPKHVITSFAGEPDSYWIAIAEQIFHHGFPYYEIQPLRALDVQPVRTRSDADLVKALESAVNAVSRVVNPRIAHAPTQEGELEEVDAAAEAQHHLMQVHAEAIAHGYLSGLPFRAVETQVQALVGQVEAIFYWEGRLTEKLPRERELWLRELKNVLEDALDTGNVLPEQTESGAVVRRGSVTEEGFRVLTRDASWIGIPTGQEPYVMCAVDIGKRQVISYSEGDLEIRDCGDDGILRCEIAAAVDFHMQRVGVQGMQDLPQELLAFVPDVQQQLVGLELDYPDATGLSL